MRTNGVIGVGSRSALKAGELDVDLAKAILGVITPCEQPQHDLWVERVHLTFQIEAISAVTQRARVDDLSTEPASTLMRDFEVQSPPRIDPHITGRIGEIIWSWSNRCAVGFHIPQRTRKLDGSAVLAHYLTLTGCSDRAGRRPAANSRVPESPRGASPSHVRLPRPEWLFCRRVGSAPERQPADWQIVR